MKVGICALRLLVFRDEVWETLLLILNTYVLYASDELIEKQKKLSVNRKLLNVCKESDTKVGMEVYKRLANVDNLVAEGGRYHDKCYKTLQIKNVKAPQAKESLVLEAARFVSDYLISNPEECQFSLYSILNNFNKNEWPQIKYLKKHLEKIFGDEIFIHPSKDGPIITVTHMSGKILTDHFYKKRVSDKREERKRIILEASKIILEDIREMVYDTQSYPPPDTFLDEIHSHIPETLKLMLNTIIRDRKSNVTKSCVKETLL